MPPLKMPEYRGDPLPVLYLCLPLPLDSLGQIDYLNLCKLAFKAGSTTVMAMTHWRGIPTWQKPAGENRFELLLLLMCPFSLAIPQLLQTSSQPRGTLSLPQSLNISLPSQSHRGGQT